MTSFKVLALSWLSIIWGVLGRESTSSGFSKEEIPLTGFIQVSRGKEPLALRIKAKVEGHEPLCGRLTINDQPNPNTSPLVGPNDFKILPKLYNDHFAWSNGRECISFIPTVANKGNWLLGSEPGHDSGYVYKESPNTEVSPLDSVDTLSTQWKWLLAGKWIGQPQMTMTCLDHLADNNDSQSDEKQLGSSYYEVEYFHARSPNDVQSTLLFPGLSSAFLKSLPSGKVGLAEKSKKRTASSLSPPQLLHLWDPVDEKFLPVTFQRTIATYGQVVAIHHNQHNSAEIADRGLLVNVEIASQSSWRLTFHLLPSIVMQDNASYAETDTLHTPPYRVDEHLVQLESNGKFRHGYQITSVLSSTAMKMDRTEQETKELANKEAQLLHTHHVNILRNTRIGDYLWLWESLPSSSSAPSRRQYEEVLVKCVQRDAHTAQLVFARYPAHRMHLMQQTVTQRTIDHYLVSYADADVNNAEDIKAMGRGEERGVLRVRGTITATQELTFPVPHAHPVTHNVAHHTLHWHSLVPLTAQPAHFLLRHLRYKEKKLSATLSSCFLYHAAVSLPAPLVYAAEILCVLLGAKPVAMVQLSSPSEHQWKFPLVTDLLRGIAATSSLYAPRSPTRTADTNASFPFAYDLFRYNDDDTLVLYRSTPRGRTLKAALRPSHTAQALHPMPFPDTSSVPGALYRSHEEQIYNAAWNGFVLGYPAYFIQSYVRSFHDNSLSEEAREVVFAQAREDFAAFHVTVCLDEEETLDEDGGKSEKVKLVDVEVDVAGGVGGRDRPCRVHATETSYEIGMGLDDEIDERALQLVLSTV